MVVEHTFSNALSNPKKKRKTLVDDTIDGRNSSSPEGGLTQKKRIFLNAFDMFTVGHLSHGQWKHPGNQSATKRRDLTYWTNLAQLLEKGDFNALFLADSYGFNETYKGSAEPAIREGCQFPMGPCYSESFSLCLSFRALLGPRSQD